MGLEGGRPGGHMGLSCLTGCRRAGIALRRGFTGAAANLMIENGCGGLTHQGNARRGPPGVSRRRLTLHLNPCFIARSINTPSRNP